MHSFVNGKPVNGQKEEKSHEEIQWITAAQQALPQLRRCHLALWPGLIWFSSACSLRSVCLPPVPVENMYHTGQETSRVTDTTPSVHAGSNLSLSCAGLQSVSHHAAYWFRSAAGSKEATGSWEAGDSPPCFFSGTALRDMPWECSVYGISIQWPSGQLLFQRLNSDVKCKRKVKNANNLLL